MSRRHSLGKILQVLKRDGAVTTARRVLSLAEDRWGLRDDDRVGLLPGDIVSSSDVTHVPPPFAVRGRPLRVGWVMTPPAVGSGGHTTAFRMVRALERSGHDTTLFLYDAFGGRINDQEAAIRSGWPDVQARVRSAQDGICDVDVCV